MRCAEKLVLFFQLVVVVVECCRCCESNWTFGTMMRFRWIRNQLSMNLEIPFDVRIDCSYNPRAVRGRVSTEIGLSEKSRCVYVASKENNTLLHCRTVDERQSKYALQLRRCDRFLATIQIIRIIGSLITVDSSKTRTPSWNKCILALRCHFAAPQRGSWRQNKSN